MPATAANSNDEQKVQDQIIAAIFHALPATDVEEIATKVSRTMGRTITPAMTNTALAHLRANAVDYGWDVPHVKRGAAVAEDEGRYRKVLVDHTGESYFEDSDREHIRKGRRSVLAGASTQLANQARMIQMIIPYERGRTIKRELSDVHDIIDHIARRLHRLVEKMDDEADGTNGG